MKNLKLQNTSEFPTSYLKVLSEFVLPLTGIKWDYSITFKKHRKSFSGNGSKYFSILRISRWFNSDRGFFALHKAHSDCGWPYNMVERRFSFGQMIPLNSITETVIYLIAHEMHHAVDDHQPKSCHREFLANDFAITVLKKYRESKPQIWAEIRTAMRKERSKQSAQEQREIQKVEYKNSPESKLQKVMAKLIEWKKVVAKAQNKVKVYNRKVKYYELRMAATKGKS